MTVEMIGNDDGDIDCNDAMTMLLMRGIMWLRLDVEDLDVGLNG